MLQPTIFIVEDDPIYSKVLNFTLSKNEFTKVHSFTSGEKAVEALSLKPDFIILDFSLGGLNGLDTLKMLKHKKVTAQIIVLTSVTDDKLAVKCLENGASHYLEKNDSSIKLVLDQLSKMQLKSKRKFWLLALIVLIVGAVVVYSIL